MVQVPSKQRILGFLATVLEPVIRLMLRTGVTWKEFSELAKGTFVDVATADFGKRGRPTNLSRVAILTGLDRREVSRLRKTSPAATIKGYQSRASQILSAWHQEPDFLDVDGNPAQIGIDGDGQTFSELMRRHAPALPVTAMLKELESVGAVARTADGRLRVLTRTYVPGRVSTERLRLWSSVLSDIGNTIEHNFSRDETTHARFERRALNLRVDPAALQDFQVMLEKEGQALLERIDDWLSAHQAPDDQPGIRLGVGMYQIEDRVVGGKIAPRSKASAGETR